MRDAFGVERSEVSKANPFKGGKILARLRPKKTSTPFNDSKWHADMGSDPTLGRLPGKTSREIFNETRARNPLSR